jgi:hypothetical protein
MKSRAFLGVLKYSLYLLIALKQKRAEDCLSTMNLPFKVSSGTIKLRKFLNGRNF